jgi:Zn-dependent metalloprotease
MQHPRPSLLPLSVGVVLVLAAASCGRAPQEVSVATLTQDAQAPLAVTYNPFTGRPSFIRGRIPVATFGLAVGDTSPAVSFGLMNRYAATFGLDNADQDLQYQATSVDSLGMRHMTLQQVYQGVDVYAATVSVHLASLGGAVTAVASNIVPDVSVPTTQPSVSEDSARAIGGAQLPNGRTVSSRLVVYPGMERESEADLAWMVEVVDDSIPARYEYVIDASNGRILDMLDRLYIARNRTTYSANNGTTLPGTLRRSESDGPVGDADVDSAHAFVGETYDYFSGTHGRDSYDDAGATLSTTVHYGTNYQNAFWNGSQMVFGDDFAVDDVTAHELTHAVTERTANLEYRWQSGALNESFSDIFGAMVDRDDWLMGEDLPIGAIRDMANPGAFGDPGNTSAWVATCGDNEGVHTNSGIPNKAFVNAANSIGKSDAERIFYRTLTVYLNAQSTLEDARAGALQSAEDLFGASSTQLQGVDSAFAAVGLDGTFNPSPNSCGVPDVSPVGLIVLLALIGTAALLRARSLGAAA